jgi:DNA-binding response OmpR family regulator
VKILLAEDDVKLGRLIKHMLETEQHQVEWVVRGDEAVVRATDAVFDIILMDWMMPGLSGLDACRQLREQSYQKPVLMLTAKDVVDDKVRGLDGGADDYLIKPFEFSELFARLRALGRRGEAPLQEEIVTVGIWQLNRTRRTVLRRSSEIQLSAREYQLLDVLIQNRGLVVPREVLLDRVWGLGSEVSDNNLDAYIRLLRKKIDDPETETLIQTVRGIGYRVGA